MCTTTTAKALRSLLFTSPRANAGEHDVVVVVVNNRRRSGGILTLGSIGATAQLAKALTHCVDHGHDDGLDCRKPVVEEVLDLSYDLNGAFNEVEDIPCERDDLRDHI
jgi:hypothetical protein